MVLKTKVEARVYANVLLAGKGYNSRSARVNNNKKKKSVIDGSRAKMQ